MIHDDGQNNFSGNRPFHDVLNARMSRRSMLQKSMMLSAAGFIGAIAGNNVLEKAEAAIVGEAGNKVQIKKSSLMGFNAVPVAEGNKTVPTISSDYEYQVLIPWGTALQPGGAEYDGDPNTRPTSAQQAAQIGIGHDGMWFFPIGKGNDHGMLAINHEYGSNSHVLGKSSPTSLEDVRVSQHAHGVSVVEIKKNSRGVWEVVRSDKSRRIHGNTPVTFSGPAANSPLLQTPAGNTPQGTLNNCANGYTPWGTYLTCEENFNSYFAAKTTTAWTRTPEQARYGLSSGSGYGWHNYDARFDLSNPAYKNEDNRFGWIVEIDPMDPTQTPVKRTALGRLKHEGIAIAVGRGGRAVGYMGDDQTFDYIYKFVSSDNWKSMQAQGLSPLDEGKLYAARFNDDGTGDWLELSLDNPLVKAKFSSQAEVLIYARLAADAAGATPMDRPEWTTVAPDGQVYCTLTNNRDRTAANVNAANPIVNNLNGHIIRWKDADQHVGTTFTWDIFAIAQDTKGTEDSFASPDGLWADPDGRLFIQTDGTQNDGLNDQMLVADTKTKEIRRLFTGVTDCEVTGLTVTPDRRTMFVNLQHPGDGNPAATNFPAPQGSGKVPRDCTIVITRKDGGIIGS